MDETSPDDLPVRAGPPPRVQQGPPQQQLDQFPSAAEWAATRRLFEGWRAVDKAPSRRSMPGTLGLYLPGDATVSALPDAALLGREFAHHHPAGDGGLHLVLPPEWRRAAIEAGWAVPHPWAGEPTVSAWTVLVFAPRDGDERRVAERLVAAAERCSRGLLDETLRAATA